MRKFHKEIIDEARRLGLREIRICNSHKKPRLIGWVFQTKVSLPIPVGTHDCSRGLKNTASKLRRRARIAISGGLNTAGTETTHFFGAGVSND